MRALEEIRADLARCDRDGTPWPAAARRLLADIPDLLGVVQAVESQEAIEAAAIALYEHTRDPDYTGAEWDWPNIDRSYDKDDPDDDDPEWLRNRLRADARVAIRAALAATADAPQPDHRPINARFYPDFEEEPLVMVDVDDEPPRPRRPQLNPLAKRERGTVALDGSAGPPTCEHGSTMPHEDRSFLSDDKIACPGPSPAVLPQPSKESK